MDQDRLTRRRFVVSAIALAGSPGLFSLSRAWAEAPGDEGAIVDMAAMARQLFPHEFLPDSAYANLLAGLAADEGFAKILDEAAAALEAASGGSWQKLDDADQVETMRAIEGESFFTAITGAVRYGIYHGKDFWEHVGYPGPSKQFGGHLDRGAGEIDWLPEDPS